MDVRYNTITWVHRSTRGWSYGSSITDPRTGEILKGHVSLGSLRDRQDYLIGEGLLSPYTTGTEAQPEIRAMVLGRLRQLSAHEVGHTIGLSHNYYDSAMGRISVLDYPHPLVTLKSDGTMDLSQAYATGIGEWDKVAVRYGYGEYPAANEAASLRQVLDQAWDKDLRFQTNQDTDVNPKVDQWNNGNDVAVELTRILAVRREDNVTFPFKFQVSGRDAMIAGTTFAGPLTLTARLSKSGDAVAAKGDLEGTARGVAVGATDVKVTLDTVKE
jgi:hypothetical protein